MSASQKKKLRKQLREEGKDNRQLEAEKALKAKKRTHTIRLIVAIVLVLAVACLFILSSNLLYSNFAAVTIGDTSYTAAEYSFFYNYSYKSFINNYSDYLSMFGLDTTKSMASQQYTEDQTWADFFKESALNTMKEVSALYNEAKTAGFTLSDEDQASYSANIENIKTGYADAGFSSANAYLISSYGKGMTVETFSTLLEKYYISQAYATEKNASFTYTPSDLSAYYAENKDTLDNFTYISYFADGSVKDDSTDTTDTEAATSPSASPATEAETAAAMLAAKETADAIVADGKTADEFKQAIVTLTQTEASEATTTGSSLSESYAAWLKDASRKDGDTTVIETDTGYYALYYISRDNNSYKTVDVRHILIKAVPADDGSYTDAAKAEAKQKTEDLLAEWKAGAATEDSFAALATANTEDTGSSTTGGLYEGIYKGQMVTEFNDWCFDPERKPGDTGIVFNEDTNYCGYHAIYYVGQGAPYSETLAESGIRSQDFSEWKEAVLANYEVKEGFTIRLARLQQ